MGIDEAPAATMEPTRTDITWLQMLGWYLIASIINGVVRHTKSGLSASLAEQILYYSTFLLGVFLIPAALVVPLHFIGKRFTAGYTAPRKLVLFWGCLLGAVLLARFLLTK